MRSAIALGLALFLAGCSGDEEPAAGPGRSRIAATAGTTRAERRLFDGAPPVIPHADFGADCLSCHRAGRGVAGVGQAPPVPHDEQQVFGAMRRCQQCHVRRTTDDVMVASTFVGLAQDLRRGERLNDLAPPVVPHQLLLRENCTACHAGPAAREEIRCSHPERTRCTQCHVEQRTQAVFAR